jgi:hypothetical protein
VVLPAPAASHDAANAVRGTKKENRTRPQSLVRF